MMSAARKTVSPMDRLPLVRGRLSQNAVLAKMTWFRVGGPADVLFRPADARDLVSFLQDCPADIPRTVIGVGSNQLVRDGGIEGIVIRLGRGFADIRVADDVVRAGAMALDINVALTAARSGRTGLEFLSGIPGTIGGALRMNAGAYGREMTDVVVEATAVDPQGTLHRFAHDELGFRYRGSAVPPDWIFIEAVLSTEPGDKERIAARIAEIRHARESTQPTRARTGGSTFKNPPGEKAWQLIDHAGCHGWRLGGVMVSEKHCNFLINTGNATAAEIEALGEQVRRCVHEVTGVRLEWEIRRIGRNGVGAEIDGLSS